MRKNMSVADFRAMVATDRFIDIPHVWGWASKTSVLDGVKITYSEGYSYDTYDRWSLTTTTEETDVNRIAIAEAGVRRCFARRHEGRYAFMPYEDAVRHCRKWIAALRDMRMEK